MITTRKGRAGRVMLRSICKHLALPSPVQEEQELGGEEVQRQRHRAAGDRGARERRFREVPWPSVDGREGAVRQINFVIVRAEEWVLQVKEFVKGAEEHHVAIQNQHAIVVHELRRVELQVLRLSAATLQHLRTAEGVLDFLEWHEGWPRQDGEAEIILRQGIWHDGQEVNGVRTFLSSLPGCVSKTHESIQPIRLTLDSVGNSSGDGQRFPFFPSTRTSILQFSQNQSAPPIARN